MSAPDRHRITHNAYRIQYRRPLCTAATLRGTAGGSPTDGSDGTPARNPSRSTWPLCPYGARP
eukprot:2609206-Rhodomonas_salina.1